ncbi:MAG: GMC family oxidoreductase N-terminal domain-containing protein [Kofleriaceae bacterium]|nr:GMC family oxidoreductase N-terminal domain-containing protein [Myxococcales bacterium]MCB9564499.1 GMC family oxidoreductase N-terminal domain-containing protein [Kofleriaceae bacterium]
MKSVEEADYVIVGGGSAGGVLAGRLSQDPACRVALIEAGGSDRTRLCTVPGMVSIIHTTPKVKKRFDWGFYTAPQPHGAGRRIPYVRGRVVGGSSAINGMVYVRGHRQNYDDWEAEGCTGWGAADATRCYKQLEDWEGGEDAYRGAGGPIAVTRSRDLVPATQALVEAIAETCGVPVVDDYNGADQEGVGACQMNARGGRRYSSSEAFVQPALARPNFHLISGAAAARVVIEGGRAVGVELIDGDRRRIVRAAREVILCAGVIGSAHLLMLSGVGPAAHLRDHGIAAIADLPVGQNLHDHLFVPMTFLAPTARHRGTALHFLGGMVKEAMHKGDTWFSRTVFDALGFVRSSQAERGVPDIQLHCLPWSYPSPNQDRPVRPVVDKRPALTVMPTLIYPKSRGEVTLTSADPTAAPHIDPHFLEEEADRRLLIEGMKLVREIMASPRLGDIVQGELHPGPAFTSDAELAAELPNRIHTVYHPVGTCRMGVDDRAVVDPQLRVRGVDGLRVADASIMPRVIGGNTNAPSMMIGERCAELIAAAH